MSEEIFHAEYAANFQFDAERLLRAFGISPGKGVTSLTLHAESNEMVELNVRRYVTKEELARMYAELEAGPAPRHIDTLYVFHENLP